MAHTNLEPRVRIRTILLAGAATVMPPATGAAAQTPPTTPASSVDARTPPAPGSAATAPAAGGDEDIIVTARLRSEPLQEAPLAVTAITARELTDRGYSNVSDIAQSAPNVTLLANNAGQGKSVGATIRGIGQADASYALDPGVGIYVDDVYLSTVSGSAFDFLDIERVEILRGPQGTLFGKNNEGGAIRFYSQRPVGDNGGYLEAGFGSYARKRFRGAFDFTLVPDTLAMRVTAGSNTSRGFFRRYDYKCANPGQAGRLPQQSFASDCKLGTLGGDNVQFGRVSLRFTPSDRLELNFGAQLIDDHGEAQPDKVLALDPNYQGGNSLAAYNANVLVPKYGVALDGRFLTDSPYTSYASLNDLERGIQFPNKNTLKSQLYSLNGTWKLSDALSLKSITGYYTYKGKFSHQQGGAPLWLAGDYEELEHSQFSQELQVLGNLFDNKLSWVVGGYYFKSSSLNYGFVDLPTFGIIFGINDRSHDETESGFVHAIYDLLPGLSLEAGGRYTHEAKDYTFNRTIPGIAFVLFPTTAKDVAFNRFDWKAGVSYKFGGNVAYATASSGFRSGGFNPRPFNQNEITTFGPEKVVSYEAGLKTSLFNRRLRFNNAIFQTNYRDLQINAFATLPGQTAPSLIYTNVGKARIRGAESEIEGDIGRLTFNASASYIDYRNLDLGAATGVPNGPTLDSKAIKTPKFKAAVGAQYRVPLGRLGTVTPRFDYSYSSKVFNDGPNTAIATQPAYGIANASLSFADPSGLYSVRVEVLNAFNKVYYGDKLWQLSSWGTVQGVPGAPRTVLVTLRRTFR